ncbi:MULTISPECIES: hypothetical protein [unclassified Mesorhizobium]|uniref:hypothetical protein n=1 Tax=unclassified Mesorhizobium TaxID=325217 RepID=UPI0015CD1F1D|nr:MULTISPECIES: hypothetical protein [unclassified Mesorhizobium]
MMTPVHHVVDAMLTVENNANAPKYYYMKEPRQKHWDAPSVFFIFGECLSKDAFLVPCAPVLQKKLDRA